MTESTTAFSVLSKTVGAGRRIGICAALWHRELVDELLRGARETLISHGVSDQDIILIDCPGSYELPVAAYRLIHHSRVDAVIALGVVIRGETAHFEYVSSPVAHGLMNLSTSTGVPCMFGVLTTDTLEQARQRCGGIHGHKGCEAAVGALQLLSAFDTSTTAQS
jgi:6,7-dimethyl-8-ribityllumazine synthase